jgi:hypothetical protein
MIHDGCLSSATGRVARRSHRHPTPIAHQREVVDAFFAAARDGDFDALAGRARLRRLDLGAVLHEES